VVRPTEVRPEKQLSFAEVKEAVQQQVFTTKLNALAKQKAQEALAKLQKGEKVDLPWSPVQTLTTEMAKQNLPPEAYQQMLSAKPINGKPAYVLLEGLPTPVLMEVVSVKVPDNAGEILPQVKEQLATVQGQNSLVLYLQSLKKTIKMKKGSQTLRVAGSAAE
jgi:peptidyl-prolyl cis-trans isomerase D